VELNIKQIKIKIFDSYMTCARLAILSEFCSKEVDDSFFCSSLCL